MTRAIDTAAVNHAMGVLQAMKAKLEGGRDLSGMEALKLKKIEDAMAIGVKLKRDLGEIPPSHHTECGWKNCPGTCWEIYGH